MRKWIALILFTVAADVAMADCIGPFGVIPEGGSIIMYRQSKPPRGVRCEWEYRYCRNGFLSGSYTEPFCTESFSSNVEGSFGTHGDTDAAVYRY